MTSSHGFMPVIYFSNLEGSCFLCVLEQFLSTLQLMFLLVCCLQYLMILKPTEPTQKSTYQEHQENHFHTALFLGQEDTFNFHPTQFSSSQGRKKSCIPEGFPVASASSFFPQLPSKPLLTMVPLLMVKTSAGQGMSHGCIELKTPFPTKCCFFKQCCSHLCNSFYSACLKVNLEILCNQA